MNFLPHQTLHTSYIIHRSKLKRSNAQTSSWLIQSSSCTSKNLKYSHKLFIIRNFKIVNAIMYLKKGTTVIVLSLVIACFSVVDALTVPLPPATTQVVVAAATGKAYLPASSSAILPSQRKLLEKTTTFNLAAATATTTATAAQGTTAATPTSSTTKPATVASSSTTKGDSSSSSTGVSITGLNFDGKIPTTEADEYIVISNRSKSPIDVSGYYV